MQLQKPRVYQFSPQKCLHIDITQVFTSRKYFYVYSPLLIFSFIFHLANSMNIRQSAHCMFPNLISSFDTDILVPNLFIWDYYIPQKSQIFDFDAFLPVNILPHIILNILFQMRQVL